MSALFAPWRSLSCDGAVSAGWAGSAQDQQEGLQDKRPKFGGVDVIERAADAAPWPDTPEGALTANSLILQQMTHLAHVGWEQRP
jgi:hypothetical protein